MPELPEVETITRQIRETISGRRVIAAVFSGLPLRRPLNDAISDQLPGRVIEAVTRYGKYIVAELDPHAFLLIHLGMTGSLLARPQVDPAADLEKHVHMRLTLADGGALDYRDPRRFGLIAFYEVAAVTDIPEIALLGKDPLARDFTGQWLFAQLRNSKRDIKAFLLDQQKIAGIGNIYASEALFLAGVRPERRADTVTEAEAALLARSIGKTLRASIRNKGTSFSDYRDAGGQKGGNQQFLRVFQRESEPCTRCGASIIRIRQSGRSSFYCPVCQR